MDSTLPLIREVDNPRVIWYINISKLIWGKFIMITFYLSIAQIVVAILLVFAVLLQARGTGLGAAFGGEGNIFRTKRGVEKILFYATIVLGILFVGIALAGLII